MYQRRFSCGTIPRYLHNITDHSWTVLHPSGFGDVVPEGLHVPGGGGAAFGTEAAVEADVFVFDHDAFCLHERLGDVEVLGEIERRDFGALAKIALFAVGREGDAARRADVDACVALDALRSVEDGLHVAVEAAFGFLVTRERIEAELDLLFAVD